MRRTRGLLGWRHALHSGVVLNTASPRTGAAVNGGAVQQAAVDIGLGGRLARGVADRLTLLLRPDPTIYDGRFASNTWLAGAAEADHQLTWDNALLVAPSMAQRLGPRHEETARSRSRAQAAHRGLGPAPAWPRTPPLITSATVASRAGEIGSNHGFNAYAVRTTAGLWRNPGLQIRPLGERYILASTQNHHLLESGAEEVPLAAEEAKRRHVVRTGTLAEFIENPDFLKAEREAPEPGMTMYPPYKYEGHAWGMAIDLNVCTGCNACVVACQAENNIPVVGKEQVLAGREMHWLRDRPLLRGRPGRVRRRTSSRVPCMHCENAPCEVVCPVAATAHSDEGLNDMVYNRCVGTRYCSNNCPYKVRRFNFLRYSRQVDRRSDSCCSTTRTSRCAAAA